MRRGGILLWLLGLTAALAVAVVAYIFHRGTTMDRLYWEALGLPRRGSTTAENRRDAARELARYRGSRRTALLLAIALNADAPEKWEGRAEAARALQPCQSPDIAVKLAGSLDAKDVLEYRLAVAETLSALPCNAACIAAVLDYLEQLWPGKVSPCDGDRAGTASELEGQLTKLSAAGYETTRSSPFSEADPDCRPAPTSHAASLYGLLRKNQPWTIQCLASRYGLGTETVSKFALHVVSRARLSQACFLVLDSEEAASRSPEFFLPRQEIRDTVAALKCR